MLGAFLIYLDISGYVFICKSKALKGLIQCLLHILGGLSFSELCLEEIRHWGSWDSSFVGRPSLLQVLRKSLSPTGKIANFFHQRSKHKLLPSFWAEKASVFRRHSSFSIAFGLCLTSFRKYFQVLSWKQKPLRKIPENVGRVRSQRIAVIHLRSKRCTAPPHTGLQSVVPDQQHPHHLVTW